MLKGYRFQISLNIIIITIKSNVHRLATQSPFQGNSGISPLSRDTFLTNKKQEQMNFGTQYIGCPKKPLMCSLCKMCYARKSLPHLAKFVSKWQAFPCVIHLYKMGSSENLATKNSSQAKHSPNTEKTTDLSLSYIKLYYRKKFVKMVRTWSPMGKNRLGQKCFQHVWVFLRMGSAKTSVLQQTSLMGVYLYLYNSPLYMF